MATANAWHYLESSLGLTFNEASDSKSSKTRNAYGSDIRHPVVIVKCNQCLKPVLSNEFMSHFEKCKNQIAVEKKSVKEPTPNPAEQPASEPVVKPQKKKKKAEDGNGSLIVSLHIDKKAKKSPTLKEKQPIDLDKQCGVLTDTGAVCTRAITCKIHSVSSKRLVTGRSRLYDTLVQLYQSKAALKKKKNSLSEQVATTQDDINQLMMAVKTFKPKPLVIPSNRCINDWSKLRSRNTLRQALSSST